MQQDARGDRRETSRYIHDQGTFMIQTTSRRIPMRQAVVAVVTAPAVAAATVAVAVAGFGLHRCEDIPLAQESPIPD
jgi:hypothetical protein